MSIFPIGDEAYDAVYAEESAMIDAGELLAEALERSGMSRADLAKKLHVSRSEVTSRFSGDRNITVRKLAATLHALGARLELGCTVPDDARENVDRVVLTYTAHKTSSRASHLEWTGRDDKHVAALAGHGEYLEAMVR